MTDQLTPRERWLSAVRMQAVDRLPFWPKLNGSYPKAQPEPFSGMEMAGIHDWIGSDDHRGIGGCLRETRRKTSVETTGRDGVLRTVYRTPHGEMELIRRFDEPSSPGIPWPFRFRLAK